MEQKKYPPSGRLFKNKSTHPKAPDMSGTLEITEELLQHLNAAHRAGEKIEMDISGYANTHPNHGTWYRLIARKPFVRQQNRGANDAKSIRRGRDEDELPF